MSFQATDTPVSLAAAVALVASLPVPLVERDVDWRLSICGFALVAVGLEGSTQPRLGVFAKG